MKARHGLCCASMRCGLRRQRWRPGGCVSVCRSLANCLWCSSCRCSCCCANCCPLPAASLLSNSLFCRRSCGRRSKTQCRTAGCCTNTRETDATRACCPACKRSSCECAARPLAGAHRAGPRPTCLPPAPRSPLSLPAQASPCCPQGAVPTLRNALPASSPHPPGPGLTPVSRLLTNPPPCNPCTSLPTHTPGPPGPSYRGEQSTRCGTCCPPSAAQCQQPLTTQHGQRCASCTLRSCRRVRRRRRRSSSGSGKGARSGDEHARPYASCWLRRCRRGQRMSSISSGRRRARRRQRDPKPRCGASARCQLEPCVCVRACAKTVCNRLAGR